MKELNRTSRDSGSKTGHCWGLPGCRTCPTRIARAPIRPMLGFGFFVAADKFFGYGKPMDPEKWWNLDLPTYGIDTRR